MDSRGLYVGQLPLSASDAKLRELFEPFGPVKTIINNVLKGYAFLYFTNPRHVDAAMAEPAHYMDGQRLRVESKSTRDYRDQKKQEEAEEAERERERKRVDGYDAGEAALQSLQEKRRRAAEAKRAEFDARHRVRLEEMEREASAEGAEAEEADEMPVIKKRTPPKGAAGGGGRGGGGGGRGGGMLRFVFAESSEGESVSVEGAGGVARYVVQGKTKGPFTEVCFDEDDDGPFLDFEEVGSSLGITPELVPRLAEYFDSIHIQHNFQGGSGGNAPAAAAAAAAPPQAAPSSKGVQGASGGQQPKPVGVAGRGAGRGRGRGT